MPDWKIPHPETADMHLSKAEQRALYEDGVRDIRLQKSFRLVDKTEKRRVRDRHWLAVCKFVDQRDKFTCRCCGRRVRKCVDVTPERLERHHIVPKSRGGFSHTSNVAATCLWCHKLIHLRQLGVVGDANDLLVFYDHEKGITWESPVPS